MLTPNLIAYIPTLNQRHLDWLAKYKGSDLFLISQAEAEKLLPRLSRNMAALPTPMVARMIVAEKLVRSVDIFDPQWDEPNLSSPVWKEWILPDEDVSHLLADKYLVPERCRFVFEMIWARYDMKVVLQEQPVISDIEISTNALDVEFMTKVVQVSQRSPDWWRTVGALAVGKNGETLAVAYNTHLPNEYETYLFGDPSLNRDAGQTGKSCALHAEAAVIALCARHGRALEGAEMYVSTFPCEGCAREIAFAGVSTVFFRDGFSSLNAQETFRAYGVRIVQVRI